MNTLTTILTVSLGLALSLGGAGLDCNSPVPVLNADSDAGESTDTVTLPTDLYPLLGGGLELAAAAARASHVNFFAPAPQLPDLNGQHSMTGAVQIRVQFIWNEQKKAYKVELYDFERGWWFAGWAFIDESTEEVYIEYDDSGISFSPAPGGGWTWDAWGPGVRGSGTMS